ncbi:hypothetical protein DFH09DRAFT_2509 [Mycena vulgaris]|nr:hypothetical protein DFH09DRAFT_2509 [Mycena vulgaris]
MPISLIWLTATISASNLHDIRSQFDCQPHRRINSETLHRFSLSDHHYYQKFPPHPSSSSSVFFSCSGRSSTPSSPPLHPLKAKSFDPVSPGAVFSLTTLILVVVIVLLVQDIVATLIVRHLMVPEPAPKRILNLLLTAADGPIDRLALMLFSPARVDVSVAATARHNHVGNRSMNVAIQWVGVSTPRLLGPSRTGLKSPRWV